MNTRWRWSTWADLVKHGTTCPRLLMTTAILSLNTACIASNAIFSPFHFWQEAQTLNDFNWKLLDISLQLIFFRVYFKTIPVCINIQFASWPKMMKKITPAGTVLRATEKNVFSPNMLKQCDVTKICSENGCNRYVSTVNHNVPEMQFWISSVQMKI